MAIDFEKEYNNSARVADAGAIAERWIAASEELRRRARAELDIAYGPDARQRYDLFCPDGTDATTPIAVFIHGGYWQALSAAESLALAPAALAQGWSYAAIEYTIAPQGSIPQMIAECHAVLAVLAGSVAPSFVTLAGHSAGAHLAAMVSLMSPAALTIDRTVLLSGVFDLRPLLQTTVNDPLGLDEAAAGALSPQLLPVTARHDVVVAWGDNETDAFKQQSTAYAAHLAAAGLVVSALECAGRHHFDIMDDVIDQSTELGRLSMGELQ